jgi:hypothetical protein
MKKYVCACLTLVVAGASVGVVAHVSSTPGQVELASSMVSPTVAADSLDQGIDLARLDTSPGVHIVPLAESAFQGDLAAGMRREIEEQASTGSYSSVHLDSAGIHAGSTDLIVAKSRLSVLDQTYDSLEAARTHLRYEPVAVTGTVLDGAVLLDVATGGEVRDGRWSGVTRTWDVPALGRVRLDESEFRETGGSITLIREWLNAKVAGFPATVKSMRRAGGKRLVSVAWVTESTAYRLDLEPIDSNRGKANEDDLLALASGLGEAG